jgi:hypothetical protein
VSLKLPLAPGGYDKGDQAQMRGAIERADQQNRKRQEDLVLGPSQRLVFYDERGTEQHFTGAILGGLVRSDMAAQGLAPAEQANARANIAAGALPGAPGGASGQIQFNAGGGFGGFTVGGDAALNVLTGTLTLATVNANAGAFGDDAHVAAFTVDAKGRVTAASSVAIGFPITAFNGRTGAIALTAADVTTALGYTPMNAAASLWGFAFEKDLSAVTAGAALVDFSSALAWTLPAGLPLCAARLSDDGTAPAAQTDFDLQVDGVSAGTLRFPAAATAASFIKAADTAVPANGKVQIFPPPNLNGMGGRLYGSIVGQR